MYDKMVTKCHTIRKFTMPTNSEETLTSGAVNCLILEPKLTTKDTNNSERET